MFETAIFTEPAGRRGQDRAAIIKHPQGIILAIADGAGGTSGGDEAADAVIMWVRAFATRTTEIHSALAWAGLLAQIDLQIRCATGQTTAVVVAVSQAGISGASVGDSGAWLIDAGALDDVTGNQTRKPLLGTGSAKPVTFERSAFSGTLLLGSDGLLKYAPRAGIVRTAQGGDLELAARSLADLACLKSGSLQDDLAIILCRRAAHPTPAKPPSQARRYILTTSGESVEQPLNGDAAESQGHNRPAGRCTTTNLSLRIVSYPPR